MGEHKLQSPVKADITLCYMIFLMKWKKLIITITASFFMTIVIIVMLLPIKYQAETKILLPQQGGQSMSAQILSQLGGLTLPGGLGSGIRTNSDLYVALLKSRTILDHIIDRFDLMKSDPGTLREDARRELLKALSIQDLKKSGIIAIAVEDKDSKRSADIANTFVDELKNLSQFIAISEASQRRLFFEEQLKSTKEALIRAEEALKGYQEQTGVIEIKEQTKTVIETIANLRARIAAKEVELKVLRTYATPQNPDFQKFEDQIRGMREQLAKLESKSSGNPNVILSTAGLPQTGTGYVRKLRELKYADALYELLMKQFELAKIDEAKNGLVIQVVEKAIPPEKKIKPKTTFYVLTITFFGFLVALTIAIIMEYLERVRCDPMKREQLERLRAYVPWSAKQVR